MVCRACGAELGGETVLDDVHSVETVLLAARGPSAPQQHADTRPDAEAFRSEPPTTLKAPNESAPPAFPKPADDETGQVTGQLLRGSGVADSSPFGSSDPPTRYLRGVDQHIELPSGSVVDDYEIDARLGEGAMGVVYGARHVKLGRRVAIKVVAPSIGADPQALARFEREARALAALHHPNIVDVYAFGTLPDGRSYFVMEYLDGIALDERLDRGRMALDESLDIIGQTARALEAAHAQGIVHRDLKPSNIYLVSLPREQRSVVKLIDFGLVQLSVADGVEKTASGAVIGTALYISPEQVRSPNVDGRTDIYALGVVAYELILGRHPFPEARTPVAAIAAHLTELPPQPRTIWPGIPAALDLLLYSMLAKDPAYRPSLAQVRNVIASGRSSTTALARRAATVSVKRGVLHARLWTLALVVLALVVGIAIGESAIGGEKRGDATTTAAPTGPTVTPIVVPAPPRPSTAAVPAAVLDAGAGPQVIPAAIERPVVRSIPRPAPSQSADEGVLALDSKPWADVLIDGERRGRTPIGALRLSAGRHKITLINATYAIKESFRVEIKQGQVEKIVKDYSDRPEVKGQP